MSNPTPLFINTAAALTAQSRIWATRPWLAIDTEFVRVDTYHPKLCLIQIGDGDTNCCVDTVALADLTPLLDVLYRPDILKLFHAAGQDLEIFVRLRGSCPAPLFDTQTAATLLGLGDQLGYAGLVDKLLGIPVDKSLSRTDWARRPLNAAEIAYAADDVRHLARIYPMLHEQLVAQNRLNWLAQDCSRQCEPTLYRTEPSEAWQRLKGLSRLAPPAQTVAAALAAWRETEAQARDRPRKWILDDEPLYRLAERQPRSLAQLQEMQLLPPKTLERHGETLLGLLGTPPGAVRLALQDELDADGKAALQGLQSRLRTIADGLKLPASFLAPRADLIELLLQGSAADIPLLRGWRREVAGEPLLAGAGLS